uniref:Phospholipid-transporting ATPase n=1 Tax=Latimeria chalumnae TaxID=7897 RepID=H3A4T4_LATCH
MAADPLRWARYRWQHLISSDASGNRDSLSFPRWGKTYRLAASGGKHRIVVPCLGHFKEEYERVSKAYTNNQIRTSKYTLLNFIPRNLFEQFHRAANLYFLFIVVLNWVPLVEAFQKEITMLPLVVVLAIIAIKDGLEDYRRHTFDKQINNLVTKVYNRKEKKYMEKCWKDVNVGDFVRLVCNEIIPADMVLLYSTDPDGICHIETSNLDGETNLKQRQVVKGLAEQGCELDPEKFASRIECESPNNDLNKFRGFIEHPAAERVGLSKENLLLRGCTIRNTEAVVGIVVYAGHETKAMLNNSGPRYKRSKLERKLNIDVLWSVLLLVVMCLIGALGHKFTYFECLNFFSETPVNLSYNTVLTFRVFSCVCVCICVCMYMCMYVCVCVCVLRKIYVLKISTDALYVANQYVVKVTPVKCRTLSHRTWACPIQTLYQIKTSDPQENHIIFGQLCIVASVYYAAKRLKLYQDIDSEDEDLPHSPAGSLSSKGKIRMLSCRSLNWQISTSLDQLTSSCPALEDGVGHGDTSPPRHVAFSSRIERDVLPDRRLLKKFKKITSHSLMLPDEAAGESSVETAYIVDFFLALATCNTVVVSSPNQPRQRVRLPPSGRTPIKSLEEIKQLFQKLSVPRLNPSLLLNGKESPSESTSTSISTLTNKLSIFNRAKLASSPSLQQRQEEKAAGSAERDTATGGQTTPLDKPKRVSCEVDRAAGSSPPGAGAPAETASISKLSYEAESPDEAALVHAARAYKCTLQSRTPDQLTVELESVGPLTFELLHILPFDSVRKRMSVVVRHPLTNKVVVYTKGADSVVMDLLHTSSKDDTKLKIQQKKIKEQTQKHLDDYAKEGLRTLCIAKKVMSDNEYEEWLNFHFLAETNIDNREELLLESAMRLETNLTLLGATGIEDRLQEGVPDTVEALRQAGVKIWVLTGDKQETAVNVAYACKLLDQEDKVFTLNASSKEACESLINLYLKELQDETCVQTANSPANLRFAPPPKRALESHFGLVIDGKTLEFALHESLEGQFLELTKCCRAVVCCRSTPLQKSKVVKLVRDKLNVLTLAIGDGANDVSMIQVADVGVGISGQEGMQAVMSSDFAISRFKHLKKLLLVHGHWCYTRLANMVLYFFYKNVAYVNLLFWYQFFCGFSGTSMSDPWILILFNLIFTSVPPIVYGILDKDVSAETLQQLPELYGSGQKSEAYLPSTFWLTMLDAFYQSLVCFFVPYFAYCGSDIDIFSFGNPVNTAALFIILSHLLIESKSWMWIHSVVLIGSILFYFAFSLIVGATCLTSNPYWIMEKQMMEPSFYLICILATVLALLPRYSFRVFQGTLFPTPLLKAARLDKLTPEEQKEAIQKWKDSQESQGVHITRTLIALNPVVDTLSTQQSNLDNTSCTLHLTGPKEVQGFSFVSEDGDMVEARNLGAGTVVFPSALKDFSSENKLSRPCSIPGTLEFTFEEDNGGTNPLERTVLRSVLGEDSTSADSFHPV